MCEFPPLPPLRYLPLERLEIPRPVDRFGYLVDACRDRRVLDLGALDETEVEKAQHSSWRWLHAELAGVATEILGVDASPWLAKSGPMTTACGTRIVYGRVEDLGSIITEFQPEVLVAGELIEHTPDTLGWLSTLPRQAPGVRFLATTPNATSIINLALAFLGRENTHQDHLQVYSCKTLVTLAQRSGFQHGRVVPYYYHSQLFRARVPSALLSLVYGLDYGLLMPLQWLFPKLAGGWIPDVALPPRVEP